MTQEKLERSYAVFHPEYIAPTLKRNNAIFHPDFLRATAPEEDRADGAALQFRFAIREMERGRNQAPERTR